MFRRSKEHSPFADSVFTHYQRWLQDVVPKIIKKTGCCDNVISDSPILNPRFMGKGCNAVNTPNATRMEFEIAPDFDEGRFEELQALFKEHGLSMTVDAAGIEGEPQKHRAIKLDIFGATDRKSVV